MNNKGILKILIIVLLMIGIFVLQPQNMVFAEDESPPIETVENSTIDVETNTEEEQNDSTPSETVITLNEKQPNEVELQQSEEVQEAPLKSMSQPETIEITNENELKNIVNQINQDDDTVTVTLKNDISLTNNQKLSINAGNLTILGENHILKACINLAQKAVLNLGKTGYASTLTIISSRNDNGVFDITGESELNIYDGVTIGPCSRIGTAGGIQAHETSTINMYGGTITECESMSVAGGVYLDGNSIFNMYGGTIQDCIGVQGGAVGLSGGKPIGASDVSSVTFNMSGGVITDCTDQYVGGGGVCIYTVYPVTFNMTGGSIEYCDTEGYGYGGGVLVYSTHSNTYVNLSSGHITDNDAVYGGGIFVFQGNVQIADGFGLYNNCADKGGDDIYNNGANVTLGKADITGIYDLCDHYIDGWYEDAIKRWSYEPCTDEDTYLVPFTHINELYTQEYGLKAAHGLSPKEPDDPDEPDNPVEPQKPSESIPTKIESTTTKTTTKVASTNNSVIITNTSTPTPKQQKTTTISEPKTPQAESEQHWALINLILSILTAISGLIFIIRKKDKKHTNKRKVIAASIALISAIIFVLTENMALPMAYTDKWTFLMIFPLIIEMINIFVIRQESKGEEEND